jgi:hypothetical protein
MLLKQISCLLCYIVIVDPLFGVLTEPIVITILLLLLLLYNIENTTHAGCITILNTFKNVFCLTI